MPANEWRYNNDYPNVRTGKSMRTERGSRVSHFETSVFDNIGYFDYRLLPETPKIQITIPSEEENQDSFNPNTHVAKKLDADSSHVQDHAQFLSENVSFPPLNESYSDPHKEKFNAAYEELSKKSNEIKGKLDRLHLDTPSFLSDQKKTLLNPPTSTLTSRGNSNKLDAFFEISSSADAQNLSTCPDFEKERHEPLSPRRFSEARNNEPLFKMDFSRASNGKNDLSPNLPVDADKNLVETPFENLEVVNQRVISTLQFIERAHKKQENLERIMLSQNRTEQLDAGQPRPRGFSNLFHGYPAELRYKRPESPNSESHRGPAKDNCRNEIPNLMSSQHRGISTRAVSHPSKKNPW
ncbi:unnamed protein product [Caenorhabditis auriculariae]|uniref:Uncharacterized protein n=1 Tax=Caenorhabditis auriculariae TaxID=2777116 RepID=A0A8S1HE25_9PELO|nr:unnamed protein product [Caenorhabditis auriculariae]